MPSQYAAGVVQGLNIIGAEKDRQARHYNAEEDRALRREELDLRRRLAEQKLNGGVGGAGTSPGVDAEAQAKADAQAAQNKVFAQGQQLIMGQLGKMTTYNALDKYAQDGSVEHIQRAFNDPIVQQAWAKRGISNPLAIDINSEQDIALLEKLGVTREMLKMPGAQKELLESHFKYQENGEWKVTSGQQLAIETRAGLEHGGQMMDVFARRQARLAAALAGTDLDLTERDVATREFEAGTADFTAKATERNNAAKVVIDTYTAETERLKAETAASTAAGGTTKMQNQEAAQQQTVALEEAFGDPGQFWETDFTDPANFNKAFPLVAAIMDLQGTKFSAEDRKSVIDISTLIDLSKNGIDLRSGDTGLVDNFVKGVEKHTKNDVDGTIARSSYTAFNNILRFTFAGKQLTDTEVAAHKAAFGHLGQQKGPVLEQMSVALGYMKSKLNAISQMNNPHAVKVMLGMSRDELNAVITELDSRIGFLKGEIVNNQPEADRPGGNTGTLGALDAQPVVIPGISPENQSILESLSNQGGTQ